jgi:hypothetical protein
MTARSTMSGAPKAIESFAPTISYIAVPPVQAALDRERGVLTVSLSPALSSADATFDDDEVFVFRAAKDGSVVGFEIPHFLTYWQSRTADLVRHLAAYSPELRREMKLCLNAIRSGATAVESAASERRMLATASNTSARPGYGITANLEPSGAFTLAPSRLSNAGLSSTGSLAAPRSDLSANVKSAESRVVFFPDYRGA